MYPLPNIKHHLALAFIAVGSLALITFLVCLVLAVAALVMPDEGEKRGAIIGSLVCGSVCGGFGWWVLRRGLLMRKAAIEAGSTAHLDSGEGWTTRTETAKPSFLKGGEANTPGEDEAPREDPRGDERNRRKMTD